MQARGGLRNFFLFDTFEGMTEPTESDIEISSGRFAWDLMKKIADRSLKDSVWCYASYEEVSSNFRSFDIDSSVLKFIKGDVAKSLKDEKNLPSEIAVLRLDTDFYESTKIELETLYPRLVSGGILILDDYGHWNGARRAVDEYFASNKRPFLAWSDYSGRIGIKP